MIGYIKRYLLVDPLPPMPTEQPYATKAELQRLTEAMAQLHEQISRITQEPDCDGACAPPINGSEIRLPML